MLGVGAKLFPQWVQIISGEAFQFSWNVCDKVLKSIGNSNTQKKKKCIVEPQLEENKIVCGSIPAQDKWSILM